jgi:hypothetical protein
LGLGWTTLRRLARLREAVRYEHAVLSEARATLPPDPARDEAAFAAWLGGLPKHGLLVKLVDTTWAQRAMKAPDLEAIHGMVAEAAVGRSGFARAVPNLTMLCGLMGTVAGLAHVVQALGPQIVSAAHSTDPRLLAEALAGQFGHLQSAFACTLHGIFWAACVAYVTSRVEGEQDHLLDEIHGFGLRDLAPRLFPRSLEQHLEALQQKLDASVTLMGAVTSQMSLASTKLGEHVALLEGATEKTAATLDRVTAYFQESAGVLRESCDAIRALQVEVHGVYVALMERHESSEERFRERAEQLIGRMDGLQGGFNTNTRAVIEQLQLASQNYAESTEQFRDAGIRFRDMSQEIGLRAYDAIAERAEGFHAALVRHEQATHLLEGQLRDLMDRLDPRLLPREEWQRVLSALEEAARALRAYEPVAGSR